MNLDYSIVPYLFLVTFILAIGLGVYMFRRTRKAREQHQHSADARVHGDTAERPEMRGPSAPRAGAGGPRPR